MTWLAQHWWLIIIELMIAVLINVYRDLTRIDVKKYLNNKPKLPPHRDNNAQWDDDDDWPKKP